MQKAKEYNYRDIVGKFVIIETPFFIPGHKRLLAYCYITDDPGLDDEEFDTIMFNVLGTYDEDKYEKEIHIQARTTYYDDLMVEIYDGDLNQDMVEFKKMFDEAFSPREGVKALREDVMLDPFREKNRPDYVNIPVLVMTDGQPDTKEYRIKLLDLSEDWLVGVNFSGDDHVNENDLVLIKKHEDFDDGFIGVSQEYDREMLESKLYSSFFPG